MYSVNRLRHPNDFRLASQKGVKASQTHVFAHLAILDSAETPRIQRQARVGFVLSKKIGNSVTRHRVKRQLKEIARPLLPLLPAYSVFVVRTVPGIAELSFSQLQAEYETLLKHALKKLTLKKQGAGARNTSGGKNEQKIAAPKPAEQQQLPQGKSLAENAPECS